MHGGIRRLPHDRHMVGKFRFAPHAAVRHVLGFCELGKQRRRWFLWGERGPIVGLGWRRFARKRRRRQDAFDQPLVLEIPGLLRPDRWRSRQPRNSRALCLFYDEVTRLWVRRLRRRGQRRRISWEKMKPCIKRYLPRPRILHPCRATVSTSGADSARPEVRAVCLNWARTDRCGGRFERTFPTAISGRRKRALKPRSCESRKSIR